MPKLDDRLKAVAMQIRCGVHADIGSDHGHLLKVLLITGRIDRGIAIENKSGPLENSRKTLEGLNAEIRLADGLAGLSPGEADCLSICGMGGELIVRILEAHPDRVPPDVILQPNRQPEVVRRWGLCSGFQLVDERIVFGRIRYVVMRLRLNKVRIDPAYEAVDRHAAELFGPLLIKRWDARFREMLVEERQFLMQFERRTDDLQRRLDVLSKLLHLKGL